MIIKIDAATENRLRLLQKSVRDQTGMTPQSVSLMVQVLLEWAMESLKGAALSELSPRMLTLPQQRRAMVGQVLAMRRQLDPAQMKQMMKTLERLKRDSSSNEEISQKIST